MRKIILATANKHKVEEMRDILKGIPVHIVPMTDFPNYPEVVENGKTLEENAAKKARAVARRYREWALADDSGLEVAYLNGEPGVFSARWAGKGCTYDDNNRKLLSLLRGVPKSRRKAAFRCVITLSDGQGRVWSVEGKISGYIAERARGQKGFGYDPLFVVPAFGKTFAELGAGTKNRISHRSKALRKAKKLIRTLIVAAKDADRPKSVIARNRVDSVS